MARRRPEETLAALAAAAITRAGRPMTGVELRAELGCRANAVAALVTRGQLRRVGRQVSGGKSVQVYDLARPGDPVVEREPLRLARALSEDALLALVQLGYEPRSCDWMAGFLDYTAVGPDGIERADLDRALGVLEELRRARYAEQHGRLYHATQAGYDRALAEGLSEDHGRVA